MIPSRINMGCQRFTVKFQEHPFLSVSMSGCSVVCVCTTQFGKLWKEGLDCLFTLYIWMPSNSSKKFKKNFKKMQKHRLSGTMSLIFSSLCESRQQTADCETLLAVSAMSHNEWVSERAKCTLSERHQFNGATRTKVPISSDILAWWVTGVRRVPPLISFIQKRPIFPPSAIGSTPPTPAPPPRREHRPNCSLCH